MAQRIRFPIRFKILVGLLFVVSLVVGVITYSMARSFHRDKTSYIHDLTSVMAVHTAEETRGLFENYRGRLRMYLLILQDREMTEAQKARKIEALFADFPDFVAVSIYDDAGVPESTVYDEEFLRESGLRREDILGYRDAQVLDWDRIRSGEIQVARTTLGEAVPALSITLAEPEDGGPGWLGLAAVLRPDGLDRLAARSRVFETFILDATGGILAHVDPRGTATADRIPRDLGEVNAFQAGLTREYAVAGEEMVGGLAPAGFAGVVVGAQIPKRAAYLASRELLRTLFVTSLVLLFLSALVSLIWSRVLTSPLERLSEAVREVGQGRFDVQVRVNSHDEIGVLGRSFNEMASELDTRETALKQAQAQLIQSEKMAAFGQLGAGIAHEVKNPLAGILGCAQLSLLSVARGTEEEKNLRLIERETRRCKDIIENLLKFARQEKSELRPIELAPVVRDAAAIVNHQLGVHQVTLELEIEDDVPFIQGNANQLQQVIMNLLINAQQAMEEGPGWVKVTLGRGAEDTVVLRVQDTGPGIAEEHLAHIFEPFFTTKRGGKGTGLGLSVSYGIVQDHRGQIAVESTSGKGTTFILTFPAADAAATPARAA